MARQYSRAELEEILPALRGRPSYAEKEKQRRDMKARERRQAIAKRARDARYREQLLEDRRLQASGGQVLWRPKWREKKEMAEEDRRRREWWAAQLVRKAAFKKK